MVFSIQGRRVELHIDFACFNGNRIFLRDAARIKDNYKIFDIALFEINSIFSIAGNSACRMLFRKIESIKAAAPKGA